MWAVGCPAPTPSGDACYETLMAEATRRIGQEVERLRGDCAHVLRETIEARHNDAVGDAWLHGRFEYSLFRRRAS
jgi:hypothetical protein